MDTEDVLVTCEICLDSEVNQDESFITDLSQVVCSNCVKICERCDIVGNSDDYWCWVDDSERWCQSCVDDYAAWCDSCEVYGTFDTYYIQDRGATYCQSCTEETQYCESCDEYYQYGCTDHSGRMIHDYSYRPDPIFHPLRDESNLFFGMEIEVEASSRISEASEYAQRLEEAELAYLKHDGSLNCGLEIVTHPMTHNFFKNQADYFWNTLEELRSGAPDRRVKSWDTTTCGVHIHISRTGFNGGAHMHRFLSLVYGNQSFYESIAGRSSTQWAKFDDICKPVYDGRSEEGFRVYKTVRSFKDKINDGRNSDRYSAINTQNRTTLEMRIFRGTVNSSTLKAYLDLAHASVEYTRDLRVGDVMVGALQDVVFMQYIEENADLYPDLCARIAKVVTPNLVSENPTE